jgi:lysophospholipase L1-like esterase
MLGWSLVLDTEAGTGFVAKGKEVSASNGSYQSRWARHAGTTQPSFVVISGGRNDVPRPPATVVSAVKRYLKTVRSAFPTAKIIVITPVVRVDQAVSPTVDAIRSAERSQADHLGLVVVDPIGEGWLDATNAHVYFAADGVQLNDAGQAYLADRLIGALASQGVHP